MVPSSAQIPRDTRRSAQQRLKQLEGDLQKADAALQAENVHGGRTPVDGGQAADRVCRDDALAGLNVAISATPNVTAGREKTVRGHTFGANRTDTTRNRAVSLDVTIQSWRPVALRERSLPSR